MSNNNQTKNSEQLEFRALGTDVFLKIVISEPERVKARIDMEKAKKIFLEKEIIFSRFNPRSELCRLNKKISLWQNCSPEMAYLCGRALYYNELSGGVYDPRVITVLEKIGYERNFRDKDFTQAKAPPFFLVQRNGLDKELRHKAEKAYFGHRMDFSGIAKGYIVDKAAKFLKERGWKNFLVDAGGDMSVSGLNDKAAKWTIAVEGISQNKLMLEVTNCGIATSGISRKKWEINGKRYHHLVNPKKPNIFSFELRTVSVIAENTEEADGRAKVLLLMGKKAGMAFARKKNIAAVFLDYKGNTFVTEKAAKYILN